MSSIEHVDKLGELSNEQIDDYLNNYPEFVGCYAKDEINYAKLNATARKYGIAGCIINLASHNKGGTHWTLLVLKNKDAYYFDPFGAPPPEEVTDKYEDVEYSTGVYQPYDDTDCGWFDMFVFLNMFLNRNAPNPLKKAIARLTTDVDRNKMLLKAYFKKISA